MLVWHLEDVDVIGGLDVADLFGVAPPFVEFLVEFLGAQKLAHQLRRQRC